MPKNHSFWTLPDGPKNRPLERQGPKKDLWLLTEVVTFGIGGRGGASRALSMINKTTGSIKGDGVCHADGIFFDFGGRLFRLFGVEKYL